MQLRELLASYYMPIVMEAGYSISQQFGEKFLFNKAVIELLGPCAGKNISDIVLTIQKQVEEIFVQEATLGDVREKIKVLYATYKTVQAEQIAQDEIGLARNIGFHVAAEQAHVPIYKTWIATCEKHKEMHGQQKYLEEMYDGEEVLFPLCMCSEVYSMDFNPIANPYHQEYRMLQA